MGLNVSVTCVPPSGLRHVIFPFSEGLIYHGTMDVIYPANITQFGLINDVSFDRFSISIVPVCSDGIFFISCQESKYVSACLTEWIGNGEF